MNEPIQVLDKGFIQLIDTMGDDNRIVQAARTSYGKDEILPNCDKCNNRRTTRSPFPPHDDIPCECVIHHDEDTKRKDRRLIRRLMMDGHTSPFEMVEFCFCVQVPMDCWRQWVRHRTASINEYSTRYAEALDFFQVADNWRLQATDNKQGSSGLLEEWPEGTRHGDLITITPDGTEYSGVLVGDADNPEEWTTEHRESPSEWLSYEEVNFHQRALELYQKRLSLGIAKEQARKDLPLSTYTRAYWKCDLHNIFNFLRLRMDSHAQLEIRTYANAMATIVKSVCPVAYEAFEDYVLHACRFSRMEMELIREMAEGYIELCPKPATMTDYEWTSFLKKLS
jgi:thymidylate synthase (FAD)